MRIQEGSSLRVLHILTCIGSKGEFGGPLKVALEDSVALSTVTKHVVIFAGIRPDATPPTAIGFKIHVRTVKPLTRKLPVSSLFNWKIPSDLFKHICKSDVVHIHFARDLVPIAAFLISKVLGKRVVIQCHGMIKKDGRKSTQIVDAFFIKPALNGSSTVLYLYDQERLELEQISRKANYLRISNGIAVDLQTKPIPINARDNKVVFCARIHPRKRLDKFVQAAVELHKSFTQIEFEIFGNDDGDLKRCLQLIDSLNASSYIQYKNALSAEAVINKLANVKLLILPSDEEPFPMVVLEALSVGTPVLVMPSCGLAKDLKLIDSNYVARTDSYVELAKSADSIIVDFERADSAHIKRATYEIFGIRKVLDTLMKAYTS